MKKIFITILVLIIEAIIIYGTIAFIQLDLNPIHWGFSARGVAAIIFSIFGVFTLLVAVMTEFNNDDAY